MSAIPAYAVPSILEFLQERKAAGDDKAEAILSRLPKKGPRKDLGLAGKTAKEKRAEHKASTGDLRADVLARSEGKCEACGVELGSAWDLHHVLSGGLRRSRQSKGNVLALCLECHRRNHRNDLGTLAQIASSPVLDAEAHRAVEHRIDLIERARLAVRSDKP